MTLFRLEQSPSTVTLNTANDSNSSKRDPLIKFAEYRDDHLIVCNLNGEDYKGFSRIEYRCS